MYPPAPQTPLTLPLNQRTVLVTTEFVRAARGTDTDTVLAEVDRGRLRWVWNVAVRRRDIRELRYLARELVAPELRHQRFAAILELMLGERGRFRTGEVGQLLFVCRPTVMRLINEGELDSHYARHARWIPRASLADFLRRRILHR